MYLREGERMNNCEQKISIIKNIRNEQGMLLKKLQQI
jgi:hypothetical protein